jgi:23S rRNA (uridine2552-2'-O)-methyltransferase
MTRWYSEKRSEHYYKKAKREGYRARSSFKLKQIQRKYRIISNGDYVLDLGAAPGGWSQVAKEFCGKKGKVIGIDISRISPIKDIVFIQGDVTDNSLIELILNEIENRYINVVISDMAPNISGNYSIDHAKSIYLSEHALKLAVQFLGNQGHFVCKLFMGESFDFFFNKVKMYFNKVHCFSPPASRKSSSEVYIIGKFFNELK